jgi:hypothetical protein
MTTREEWEVFFPRKDFLRWFPVQDYISAEDKKKRKMIKPIKTSLTFRTRVFDLAVFMYSYFKNSWFGIGWGSTAYFFSWMETFFREEYLTPLSKKAYEKQYNNLKTNKNFQDIKDERLFMTWCFMKHILDTLIENALFRVHDDKTVPRITEKDLGNFLRSLSIQDNKILRFLWSNHF